MGGSSSTSKSETKNEQIVPAEPQLTPEEQEERRRQMQLTNNLRIIEKTKSDSERITAEAAELKLQVGQFLDTIDPNNPDISQKKELESFKKACLTFSESLMRCLFSLDSIVESPETRNERKQLVLDIQDTLSALDAVKTTLQPILDKLKELEPPSPENVVEDPNVRPSSDPMLVQTQDNNTTPASDSTSPTKAAVETEATADSGII
mmetsp:Transcript_17592/g.24417  ORF Transcript_17592/g.24417 Transcript_17592/m.24417 type:complete len:207 (+) Transcript_17592:542-1162(+)